MHDQDVHAMPKTRSRLTDSGVAVLNVDDIAEMHSDHQAAGQSRSRDDRI